jgi:uncharacterized membrane protein YkvA (DUF1232 family)
MMGTSMTTEFDPDLIIDVDKNAMQRDEVEVRRGFWTTLKRAASVIPFIEDLVAAYFAAFDTQTPMRVRAALLSALAYFVLPFDAVPDFIIGLGFTDDATVLLGVIMMMNDHIKPKHRKAARQILDTSEETIQKG